MMDKGNYMPYSTQAEVTDDGPFDKREMDERKEAALRGLDKSKTYPGAVDMNLGVLPSELLVYRKGPRNQSRSGNARVAVFSSFNGKNMSRWKTKDQAKRAHGVAGISHTLYQLDGADVSATAYGKGYQTDSGIVWSHSGKDQMGRNTGSETIFAGDLVYIDFPPFPGNLTGAYNQNPSYGMPKAKLVLETKPFRAGEFHSQLETYSYLFKVSKSGGGIVDMDISDLYKHQPGRPYEKTASDCQLAAGSLWFGLFGIWARIQEAIIDLRANGAVLPTDSHANIIATLNALGVFKNTINDRASAKTCVDAVLLDHTYGSADRTAAKQIFAQSHVALPTNPAKTTDLVTEKCAIMCHDALKMIFMAQGEAAAEQNRWILGRALKTSEPGKDLVVDCGSYSRPCSK